MMIKKVLSIFFFSFFIMGELMACPMCTGQDPRDKYYIYIIGIFVLLIYVPMFYLFKTAMKHKNVNNHLPK